MILDRHPDIPGKKLDSPLKFIGYWHSMIVQEDRYGIPLRTAHEFDRYESLFGECGLPLPHEWIDSTWDAAERALVAAYLKAHPVWESWRGNAFCRFDRCSDRCVPGYRDFTDGTYVWPEGFVHYIERHKVKPPQEFIDHVKSSLRVCMSDKREESTSEPA